MTSVLTVDARWACLTFQQLKERGIPTDRALKEAGLYRSQVRDPDKRIPFYKHALFMEIAAQRLDDPFFGLHLGTSIHPKQVGLLGYVTLNSATLGEAMKNMERYLRVLSEGAELKVEIHKDQVAVVSTIVDPDVSGHRQLTEFGLSGQLNACRALAAVPLVPVRVDFRLPRTSELAEYKRVFGAPVRFGQAKNALWFKREVLDVPIRSADSGLLHILERYCRDILGRRPKNEDLVYQVRTLIADLLPTGEPNIDTVARELSMSSRTLERRLRERDLTYRVVLDVLRHQLALCYLKDRRLGLAQITYLLGYSEPSAFNRAFRRWTGATPSQFRAQAS